MSHSEGGHHHAVEWTVGHVIIIICCFLTLVTGMFQMAIFILFDRLRIVANGYIIGNNISDLLLVSSWIFFDFAFITNESSWHCTLQGSRSYFIFSRVSYLLKFRLVYPMFLVAFCVLFYFNRMEYL